MNSSSAQHESVRSAAVWTIPPGITVAYFCPPSVTPWEFLFYALPILAGYWFLSFKTSQLLQQWKSQPRISKSDIQETAIRFKYFFGVSLLIPVIIFTAQAPAPAEIFTASGIQDVKQGQVMIWGIRNLLALVLTSLVSIFLYRQLQGRINRQPELDSEKYDPEKDVENHENK